MNATLFFSDGSVADFTRSVKWSSSNTAVVEVSNADIPVPAQSSSVFAPGALVPVSPGTATVTASFDRLSASVKVSVDAPKNLQIRKVDQARLVQVPEVIMAPGSTQNLTLVGDFDGVQRNVGAQVNWSFQTPDTSVATINPTTGAISALAPGGPLTAVASSSLCSLSAAMPVTVAPVQSLVIAPQFGGAALIVGDLERFDVLANFASGPQQDLSTQAALTSSNTAEAAFGSAAAPNYLVSIADGAPVTVSASFGSGSSAVQAVPVTVSLVAANLQSLVVTPNETSLTANAPMTQYPGTGAQVAQFQAAGSFDNGQTQDVTSVARWSSSNTALAIVNSLLPISGLATAGGSSTGSVVVTAQDSRAAQNPLATAQLDLVPAPTASAP
ncbi:MAG: hypothetical protein KGJ55_05075 [Gammaproteobacteria bacterium]|nr:hypothetical protein [Gammaproteobacteria bacterium]